jgi:ribosome-binding factor A
MGRLERVAQAIKKEISQIIHDELNDPRLGFITIMRVELTEDLRCAKIYFSVFGDDLRIKETKEGLASAQGYIRKLIGRRIKLRFVPEIVFKLDKSVEYSIYIQKELDRLKEDGLKTGN